MHLFTKNYAIVWIILLHGWLLFLIGMEPIVGGIPIMVFPLLLVVEFVLANIWLWYSRETYWFDRLTGFVVATGFILISLQMIVCFIGARRGGDVVRYFLVVAMALACVIPVCMVARFVVRREIRLLTKYRTDLSKTWKQQLFCRMVNSLTALGTMGAWWYFEQRFGILEEYAGRTLNMDSLADAFPLSHIMATLIILVLAFFLTLTLLAMRRWAFFISWLVSTLVMTFAGYPVWRAGRIFLSAGPRNGNGAVESVALLGIGLMIFAVRATGNRMIPLEERPLSHEIGNRWWNRLSRRIRPAGIWIALLLVVVPIVRSSYYFPYRMMWMGGQQRELDIRIDRGRRTHLRSEEEIALTDDMVESFLSYPVFRSIQMHDCSALSPQVLRLVTEQPDLDRLLLADVPSGLREMELGSLHRLQSLNVQGPGITSSFLKTLRSRRFFVSFGPQQGHIFDRGRRGYRGFVQPDPIRPSPFGIESVQLQLHSTSPGFDGMLVNQWLKRNQRAGEDGAEELRVRMDLVAVESVVFAEFAKIQNPSRCFLMVHDDRVSLKDHQFGQLHQNPHLRSLEIQQQLPQDDPDDLILPQLEFLRLPEGITDGWIQWLASQPRLRSLSITLRNPDPEFKLSSLNALRQIGSLRKLQVHGSMTPALVEQIRSLTMLESLLIDDAMITDGQLAQMGGLPNLKEFHIEKIMSNRTLRQIVADPEQFKRVFPDPIRLTEQGIFSFISQVPDTTIYQFLEPRLLQQLMGTGGRIEENDLIVWGSLLKHGYSHESIAAIVSTLRRKIGPLSDATLFPWSEWNEESIDQLKGMVTLNGNTDLDMFDASPQPVDGAIVLGPGIREEWLTRESVPQKLALLATGISGLFVEDLDVQPNTSIVLAGEIRNPRAVIEASIHKKLNLHLQQFSQQGGLFQLASQFELLHAEPIQLAADDGSGFLNNGDVSVLIVHQDSQGVTSSLPDNPKVNVLALDESMLTEAMTDWILSNSHLSILCLDPTLTALSQSAGNQQIAFSELSSENQEAHKWDLILPLLRKKQELSIYTRFGSITPQSAILKNSRLENILPQLSLAYPDIQSVEAFGSILTMEGENEPLNAVTLLELNNGLIVGSQNLFSELATWFPNLTVLQLSGTQTEHWDLDGLRSLEHLQELNLTGCDIGDKEIRGLEAMEQLKILSLSRTQITNDSLGVLGTLTGLRRLNVYQTRMDADAVLSLRTFLPRCKIYGALSDNH